MTEKTAQDRIRALRRFQRQGCPDDVALRWADIARDFPDNPAAQAGQGEALDYLDMPAAALPYLQRAAELAPANLSIRLKHLSALSRTSPGEAQESWQTLIENFPQSGRARRAYAEFLVGQDAPNKALNILHPATKPDHPGFGDGRTLLETVRILKDIGREPRALERFRPYLESQDTRPALVRTAAQVSKLELAQTPENRALFTEYFRAAFRDRPDDFGAYQQLCFYLKDLERQDAIDAATQKFQARSRLPRSLKDRICALVNPKFPTCFTHKIWRLWRLSNNAPQDWPDWISRAAWGDAARSAIQTSLYTYGDGDDVLNDMFVTPDETEIDRLFKLPQGALIAAHHQSPAFLTARLSRTFIPEFATLLSGRHRGYFGESDLDIVVSEDQIASVRAIVAHLKRGGNMAIASDYRTPGLDTWYPLGDGEIRLGRMVPRLAYKFSVPTVWAEQFWDGHRVGLRFEDMPHPLTNETETEFTERWMASYVEKIERCLKDDPANINFRHGLVEDFKPAGAMSPD